MSGLRSIEGRIRKGSVIFFLSDAIAPLTLLVAGLASGQSRVRGTPSVDIVLRWRRVKYQHNET